MSASFVRYKTESGKLNYGFILSDWLCDDTLSTAVWTVPTGLTEVSSEINSTTLTIDNQEYAANTVATIVLSGGTEGQKYTLYCLVTTANGYQEKFKLEMIVRNK